MAGFQLPGLGLEVNCILGYFLCAVALWSLIGRCYPLVGLVRSWLPAGNLGKRYGRGSWAVVTGAARGLGSGFCTALAQEGFNIVLVSRSNASQLAARLETTYKVQTKVISKDFTGHGHNLQSLYEEITCELEDLDVSILVNNAGVALDGLFAKQSHSDILSHLEVNIWPIVLLSRWAVGKMSRRKQPSAIINLSSISGITPYAGLALYSTTKRFDDFFSHAIANEVECSSATPIDVLSLLPGYVHTDILNGLTVKADPKETVTVEASVSGALKALGRTKHTYATWTHTVMAGKAELHSEASESKEYLSALLTA